MNERYSIECSEGEALIHGYLTITEAFDFLSYYEKKGFTCLIPGDQNSCMRLSITPVGIPSTEIDDDEDFDSLLGEKIQQLEYFSSENRKHKELWEQAKDEIHMLKTRIDRIMSTKQKMEEIDEKL